MSAEVTDFRYELKAAYEPQQDGRMVAWVKAHVDAFSVAYPSRRVHNIYFDTPDLEAFEENLAGISQRCKVRFRWSGEDTRPQAGTLELKNKHTSLGWKDNYPIESAPFAEGNAWRAVVRKIRAALPPEARLILDQNAQPALINCYTRRYFASRDRTLRITLDSDQEMFDQLRSHRPNFTRRLNLPPVNILEIKCDWSHRDQAVRALADCPLRLSRFSKYTTGSWLR